MTKDIENLFVYGTLAPNRPNEHILKPFAGTWLPAHIRGKLYSDGWGAALGYPAVVLNESSEMIEGLIFASNEIDWAMLDAFEGEGYRRKIVTATLDTGEHVEAFVYTLNKEKA